MSLTIEWNPGWDGGHPQTFTVSYIISGTSDSALLLPGLPDIRTDGKIKTTLTAGISSTTTYDVTVFATNEKGDGGSITEQISTIGKHDTIGL